jgi:hypothetical protein
LKKKKSEFSKRKGIRAFAYSSEVIAPGNMKSNGVRDSSLKKKIWIYLVKDEKKVIA